MTMHAISTITWLDVEPGHLEVDPHQPVVVGRRARTARGRERSATARTLPVRAARVDSRADGRSLRRLASPTPTLLRDSNVARFMAASTASPTSPTLVARSIDEPEWFWDAVVRFLGLRFATPYDAGARHHRRHPVGEVVHRRDAATSRRRASTVRADDRRRRSPRSSGKARKATSARSRGAELRDADRSHRRRVSRRAASATGDAVGLFLPMVPETVAALFAVAKLGAIFLPIFSGYGADAVAVRLARRDAVALVTADGFTRRGKVVPMKETADAAVARGRRRCTPSSSCPGSAAPTCR